jgi:uncharacterized hydantoinase/oxoprolinase family protein
MSKNEKNDVKRGRGRPPVYVGALKTHIVALIASVGLTNTRKLLTHSGAVRKSYEKQFGVTVPNGVGKMNISMVTLCHMGQEAGVELQRGRPRKVAA